MIQPIVVCSKTDCGRVAVANPELRVWASTMSAQDRSQKNYAPLRMHLPLCERCTMLTKAPDVLTDQSWEQIVSVFTRAGRAAPDRTSAVLVWRPISLGLGLG